MTSYDYEVRAYDAAVNESAWISVLSVTTHAEPPVESDLIDFGADWKYLDDGVYPGSAWTDAGMVSPGRL